jgi:hypothetical protein
MLERDRQLPYSLIGTWHSHPTYREGGPHPSAPDRDSWSLCFENYRRGHDEAWIGLILGPRTPPEVDDDPWYPPARGAWVIRSGDDGSTIIDTAKMKWAFAQ